MMMMMMIVMIMMIERISITIKFRVKDQLTISGLQIISNENLVVLVISSRCMSHDLLMEDDGKFVS